MLVACERPLEHYAHYGLSAPVEMFANDASIPGSGDGWPMRLSRLTAGLLGSGCVFGPSVGPVVKVPADMYSAELQSYYVNTKTD